MPVDAPTDDSTVVASTPPVTSVPPARPRPRAEPGEPATGADAVRAVAQRGNKAQPIEVEDALAWFLEEGGDERPTESDDFHLNFGGPVDDDGNGLDATNPPVWVPWSITGLDDKVIDDARKASTRGNRNQKRRGDGEVDETEVARRLVFAGTVSPDVPAYGKRRQLVDPADVVRSMFKRKPGLVLQVSGRILNFSGYDENDVREVEAGKP